MTKQERMNMTTAAVDKGRLIDEYLKAVKADDEDRIAELARLMPIPPGLAKSALRFRLQLCLSHLPHMTGFFQRTL